MVASPYNVAYNEAMSETTTTTTDARAFPARAIVGYRFSAFDNVTDAMSREESGTWLPAGDEARLAGRVAWLLEQGLVATVTTYRRDEWKDDPDQAEADYGTCPYEADDDPAATLEALADYAMAGGC